MVGQTVGHYRIVPVDGRSPVNTGIVERFKAQAAVLDLAPAWLGTSFVFAAGTRDGVMLFRQRFEPESFDMVDQPEPITHGTEWAAWPSAAGNRLAFVSAHPDHTLWSIRLDPSSGVAARPPQRITRGPGCPIRGSRPTALASRSTPHHPAVRRQCSWRLSQGRCPFRKMPGPWSTSPASHPFWSADGRLLYYLPIMPNTDLRSGARARRIGGASGRPEGDAFDAIAFKEMFVPTMVPGTAPFVASDHVICVLADLRGDIWVMSV
jgi:hypothetical protein